MLMDWQYFNHDLFGVVHVVEEEVSFPRKLLEEIFLSAPILAFPNTAFPSLFPDTNYIFNPVLLERSGFCVLYIHGPVLDSVW